MFCNVDDYVLLLIGDTDGCSYSGYTNGAGISPPDYYDLQH